MIGAAEVIKLDDDDEAAGDAELAARRNEAGAADKPAFAALTGVIRPVDPTVACTVIIADRLAPATLGPAANDDPAFGAVLPLGELILGDTCALDAGTNNFGRGEPTARLGVDTEGASLFFAALDRILKTSRLPSYHINSSMRALF